MFVFVMQIIEVNLLVINLNVDMNNESKGKKFEKTVSSKSVVR